MDSGGSGSKIPLLKSKADIQDVGGEVNSDGSDHRRKRTSLTTTSLGGVSNPKSSRSVKSDSGRSAAASSSTNMQLVHRTVEKVKLSKGIEMSRVVQVIIKITKINNECERECKSIEIFVCKYLRKQME